MTRAILTALLLGAGVLIAATPGCKDQGVGDPCTPEQEYDPSFSGFSKGEVNVESKSFQCRTRICLVNHFQGRASCPYGQSVEGAKPSGAADSCRIPGTKDPITGLTKASDPRSFRDEKEKALVRAQCVDRKANDAVYCSCRCGDINGQKPSDPTFCDCPDGFTCEPLVTSIGQGNEGLTGSYCIKSGTAFDKDKSCNQGDCDPVAKKCD